MGAPVAREFSRAEADRHDALTAKGWALTEGRLLLAGRESGRPPGWFDRWQLRRAMRAFEESLAINPEGWSSMWALGKIHQRLGARESAFTWFSKAHAINPGQADVAREGGIAALDLGRVAEGLAMCKAACVSGPEDAGLLCNLALAHCLAGQDAEAVAAAADAVSRDATDSISANVLSFVREVAAGKRPRPRNLAEAFPNH